MYKKTFIAIIFLGVAVACACSNLDTFTSDQSGTTTIENFADKNIDNLKWPELHQYFTNTLPTELQMTLEGDEYFIGAVALSAQALFEPSDSFRYSWEIFFPQIYNVNPSNEFDVSAINQLILEQLYNLMQYPIHPSPPKIIVYDICFADEEYLSVCFFGQEQQNKGYLFDAFTINLQECRLASLCEIIDTSTLNKSILLTEYNNVYKNSFIKDENLTGFLNESVGIEYFLDNLEATNIFILSKDSSDGLFLVLKHGLYYAIVSKS